MGIDKIVVNAHLDLIYEKSSWFGENRKGGFKKMISHQDWLHRYCKKTFSYTQVYLWMQSVVYIAYVSFVCT